MSNDSTYTPSDQITLLAKVGDEVLFEVTATNDGNVDVHNTAMSNDMFLNSAGGWCVCCLSAEVEIPLAGALCAEDA